MGLIAERTASGRTGNLRDQTLMVKIIRSERIVAKDEEGGKKDCHDSVDGRTRRPEMIG